jgi:succinyl-CoA synthetase alpha subunit
VTVHDCAVLYAAAKAKGVHVVGPSSVGIISPGKAKLGSIGSGGVDQIFMPGNIGVISKSGGMTAEIAVVLSRAGIGQSTVVGIGGDQIIGSDFVDLLELFEEDSETKATVIFGEIGGTYEERVAEYVLAKKIKKPIVAVVAGKFTATLPQGTVLGHAGAIVSRGRGSYTSKINALRDAKIPVAQTLEEIPGLLKLYL